MFVQFSKKKLDLNESDFSKQTLLKCIFFCSTIQLLFTVKTYQTDKTLLRTIAKLKKVPELTRDGSWV